MMPSNTLFADVDLAPRDPILGLSEQFSADPNPAKVNKTSARTSRAPTVAPRAPRTSRARGRAAKAAAGHTPIELMGGPAT